LNLTDAQYDTTAANGSNIFPIFVATPNSSATNLLTISKTGAAATLAYRGNNISASGAGYGTGVSTTALGHTQVPLLAVCASYTTISNLNLTSHGTSPQQVEIGLAVFELFGNQGAQHNMFDKISVDLDRNQGGSYGISSFSTTSPGGLLGSNSYNTYRDISIKDCNYGISLSAPNNATGPADQGNQIITSSCNTFNYIGDPNVPDDIISGSPSGISIGGQYNFTIRNCIIQNITATSIYSTSGIIVGNSYGANEISNNIIRTIRRSSTSLNSAHWIAGIRINWPNQTMSFKVFNNSISNLLSSYTGAPTTIWAVVGIFIESNTGNITTELYNNSVSLNGSTFPNASSGCLSMNSVSKASQIKNNVFANFTAAQTGVAHHTCFYTNSASQYGSVGSLSNYNSFYIADTSGGFIGRATTTYFKTLAQWQAAMTLNPGSDANSIVANPNFVNNATDLHATPASTSLDGTGTTPPAYITTDLDCKPRTAPHDIGCYFAGCEANGGTISPDSVSLCAQQTYVMSATGYSSYPGITYQWQRSTTEGGPYSNVTGGSGATTATYTTGKLTTGTYYYVLKVTCPAALTDYSDELKVVVKALPTATITAATDTIFCSGGTVQLDAATAANRSYQWKKGTNDIAGATTANYTATSSATYKVVVTNTQNGCTKSSNGIKVTSNPLPAAVITPQGPTTFCAGDSVVLQASVATGYTYKWKKGTNFIAGETASSYTAKTAGTYKVEVTDSNGCSKLAPGKAITVNCREGNLVSETISVTPNPASSEISITLPFEDSFKIEIVNTLGETILNAENQSTIDISKIPNGIYFIKVFNSKHLITEKFVKE
ncbi:MAG: T9SS type A sorting domain-containing protein, partial [Bacteroidia bacterium]